MSKYVILTKSGKETFVRYTNVRESWAKKINKCDSCGTEHKMPVFSCHKKMFCSEKCLDKEFPRARYV